MSVQELESLARKHWAEWLPEKVADLKREGKYPEEVHAAAVLAQREIEHLMQDRHYSISEAREVALPQYILLKPEAPPEDDEQEEELREMEREYQKNPPPASQM